MVTTKVQKFNEISTTNQLGQRESEKRDELMKQLISFPLKEEDPSRMAQLGALLSNEERSQPMMQC